MNRTGTGARVSGKWWLPESTIAEASSGIMKSDGQIIHIILSGLVSGSNKEITTLIGMLDGHQETIQFHVMPIKMNISGFSNSGMTTEMDFLVTDYEPITKK